MRNDEDELKNEIRTLKKKIDSLEKIIFCLGDDIDDINKKPVEECEQDYANSAPIVPKPRRYERNVTYPDGSHEDCSILVDEDLGFC